MNTAATDARLRDEVAWHATLRFAVGVTLAFVVSEIMQWAPTFLAPVLARREPNRKARTEAAE